MNKKKTIKKPKLLFYILCTFIFSIFTLIAWKLSNITPQTHPTSQPIIKINTTANIKPTPEPQAVEAIKEEQLNDNSLEKIITSTSMISVTYVPKNLVSISVPTTKQNIKLRKEAADALNKMYQAIQKEDLPFFISDGYRRYAEQEIRYQSFVAQFGEAKAKTMCPQPGHAENQTGLAIEVTDIQNSPYRKNFDESKLGKWMIQHSHEYGFIQRYPKQKSKYTYYEDMPWVFRYVGKDLAKKLFAISPDETIEEFYALY